MITMDGCEQGSRLVNWCEEEIRCVHICAAFMTKSVVSEQIADSGETESHPLPVLRIA